jgi:LAO/AO transport system kinase
MSRPPLDRRALGLALTGIANGGTTAALASEEPASAAWRIGITGAPGAGKSTLTGHLALHRRQRGRVGILAIDPTSPLSGGAILGDRIRMDDLPGIEDLYIRSFGSRSASDGLTDHLPDLLGVMDRFDFDEVLLETVGVGQAELAVRTQVDTLVVVIPPDAGDGIQAMKAGMMEIADIFAVNKADMASASRMATEIQRSLALARAPAGRWRPPVLLTSQSQPASIVVLSQQIDAHRHWLRDSGTHAERLLARGKYRLRRCLERRVGSAIDGALPDTFARPLAQQILTLLRCLHAEAERAHEDAESLHRDAERLHADAECLREEAQQPQVTNKI